MTTQPDQESMDPAPPGTAAEPLSESERLAGELAEARAKAEEHWNSYLRAVAETENVRKRAQRDVESAARYAIDRFAGELLDVRDSLELGVAAGSDAGPVRLLEGMEATLRLLNKAFEKCGLTVVDPQGQPFNPELHEAIATQESADQAAGSVMAVVQKGYVLNGRLLRPARVVVARAPESAAQAAS
jgi:molecular chaperone GrpE